MNPTTRTQPTRTPIAVAPCQAAGCDKLAIGLPHCGLHARAFSPGIDLSRCRIPGCEVKPLSHGVCYPHYRRVTRLLARAEKGDAAAVDSLAAGDWTRPAGERLLPEQRHANTRMLTALFDRIDAHCGPDETVYDKLREALEAHALTLPEPTPAQWRALARRRAKAERARATASRRPGRGETPRAAVRARRSDAPARTRGARSR